MNKKRFKIDTTSEIGHIYINNQDGEHMSWIEVENTLNEQQATINELQSIINHIKCEENCFDYDYCCETVCSLYNEIRHLKEENEQLKSKLNKGL